MVSKGKFIEGRKVPLRVLRRRGNNRFLSSPSRGSVKVALSKNQYMIELWLPQKQAVTDLVK